MKLPLVVIPVSLALPAVSAEDIAERPSAEVIAERALERAERNDEQRPEIDFGYRLVSTLE